MDKQPVGQLPDLTQSNNDDEIMVITNSEYNQLKKEKISDFITDLTSTDENNALTKGTDSKLFVTDFGNADNIINGTIDTERLPNSGVAAGKYIYPTNMQVNDKGQIVSVENGVTADITKEQIDTVAARPLSDNACTQENFPDEYSYWLDQAHSTFDLSKFKVVGSPTISEDGIASGFSDTNYLATNLTLTNNDKIFSQQQVIFKQINENAQVIWSIFTTRLELNANSISFKWNNVTILTSNFITTLKDGDIIDIRLLLNDNNKNTLIVDINGVNEINITNNTALSDLSISSIVVGKYHQADNYYWQGAINLKYFQIIKNGEIVVDGRKTAIDTINDTLEIPYTETTDGTKIVDAAYFDRVQSCYEQTGQALYLTLDEQNQAYYLPQGTVSGMISRNKQKIDELDTTLTAEILQAMPVGASIAYEGTTAPDGWFAENGLEVQKSEYPKLYAVVGDKYNLGTTQEGYFRLPDTNISSRFYEGSTTPGTLKNAGLPNITATGTGFGVGVIVQVGGAAYDSNVEAERIAGGNQDGKRIDFNASRSSSVYGKSTTVQPKSITKFFIIKHD